MTSPVKDIQSVADQIRYDVNGSLVRAMEDYPGLRVRIEAYADDVEGPIKLTIDVAVGVMGKQP
jgi:hypothetical protein